MCSVLRPQSTPLFVERLLIELRCLYLLLGRLVDSPHHTAFNSSIKQQHSAAMHAFHLHLDIRWYIAEILHLLSVQFPGQFTGII